MATKLNLYNNALLELGERPLSSLTENRKPRRVLDQIWDSGFTDDVLIAAFWNCATRTVEVDYDAAVSPEFGFTRGFSQPTDFLRTVAISADENFSMPLDEEGYADEGGYWYAEPDTIYVRYISNDETYGGNLASWPPNMRRFAEVLLASRACTAITQDKIKTRELTGESERLLIKAKSSDAMNEGAKFPPRGTWVRARFGDRNKGERRGS